MTHSTTRYPITLGDKSYEVSPINDVAHDSLDNWIREEYLQHAAALIAKLPQADKEIALRVAYSTALTMSWLSGEGARLVGTMRGIARVLWEGIRINHPDVPYEEILRHIQNPEIISNANKVFNALNTRKVADKDGETKKQQPKNRQKILQAKRRSHAKKST